MRYAHVALNVPLNQLFSYHVPDALEDVLRVGHLVRVAFGTTTQPALVVAINSESSVPATKPVQDMLDPLPVVDEVQIAISQALADSTIAPIGAALWLWLPPAFTGKSVRVVHLAETTEAPTTPLEQQMVAYLAQHPGARESALEKQFGLDAKRALNALKKRGLILYSSTLTAPAVRAKTVRTARLIVPEQALTGLRLGPKARLIVEYLAQSDTAHDLSELASNLEATSADLLGLERKGLIRLGERLVYRDRLADQDFVPYDAPTLTDEQHSVWQQVLGLLNHADGRTALLHGVTGSGKTEIYLRAIDETLRRGQQAIFLVPEIALTPQTIHRVAARFPDRVGVVHSGLSAGERYDTWQRVRRGELDIVVGTRSALFMPMPRLGLVVIDEEHDPSYKQAPPIHPPYYHARAVAEMLVQRRGGTLILGSATPDLETYYRAQQGQIQYLRLPNRIMGHRARIESQARREGVLPRYEATDGDSMTIGLPPVQIVDMREELKSGNLSIFSRALQDALAETLERNEQAILFLNRRGQATYVFCRDCGYVELCPRCTTPMTYHRHGEALRCHHCGFMQPALTECPVCHSKRIKYFGAGTQHVEAELKRLFPTVQSVRWDADTASNIDAHEAILASFASHEMQVLIGTQMIAKGLDLPLVTLVGVVSADMGLALPDFRATERAFQLLTQVAGRAGRGVLGGKVILQTYQPKHESIVAASHHDYERFYQHELPARRDLGYPPFRRVARLLVQSPNPVEAQRTAEALARQLQALIDEQELSDTTIIGPAPAFFTRIDNYYRWHVLVRSTDPTALIRGISYPSGVYIDVDTIDVL